MHTKGPWKLTAVVGSSIGVIPKERPKGVAVRDVEDIACVCLEHEQIPRNEAMANARLIAAAPSLLAVCKRMLSGWNAVDPNESVPESLNIDEDWEALEAVIARAGG